MSTMEKDHVFGDVYIDGNTMEDILAAAHEARLLKRWLVEKRDTYATINHEEIKAVCGMFAADKEDENK